MAAKFHQISLKETFSDCQDKFFDDTPSFFLLLEEHIDLNLFIPSVFSNAFYQTLGRKRTYPLTGFLSALILQKIFSIPSDSLLILFLSLCKELQSKANGFATAKNPAAPQKKDAPLILMKTWIFECFPASSEIPKNGYPFTKSGPL